MDEQQKTALPERVIEHPKVVESVVFHTVLSKPVYEELRALAQEFSTGRGNWDFGVAIQILLEGRRASKLAILGEKIDAILSIITVPTPEEPKKEEPKPKVFEMMGKGNDIKL